MNCEFGERVDREARRRGFDRAQRRLSLSECSTRYRGNKPRSYDTNVIRFIGVIGRSTTVGARDRRHVTADRPCSSSLPCRMIGRCSPTGNGQLIVPWQCQICGRRFDTPRGGICSSCHRSTCRRCLTAAAAGKGSGGWGVRFPAALFGKVWICRSRASSTMKVDDTSHAVMKSSDDPTKPPRC